MKLALICGAALTVVGILVTPMALRWMNTPADVIEGATIYLRVYFCGVIPSLLYNMGSSVLRAVGDAKRPLYFLIFTTVVNIGLDVLFVAVFKMGIFGAALATILAQASSAVLVLRTLLNTNESYRLVLGGCEVYPEVFQQIVRLGLPSGFQYMLYTVSNLVVQAKVNLLGTRCGGGLGGHQQTGWRVLADDDSLWNGDNNFYRSELWRGKNGQSTPGNARRHCAFLWPDGGDLSAASYFCTAAHRYFFNG